MAAIDPSRGPAPPRPLLLAVVVEMGRDGSMVAAGGGSGPDLGLVLTLTLTRRQEAVAAGGDRLPGSGEPLPALLPWVLRRVRDAPPGPIHYHGFLLGGERRPWGRSTPRPPPRGASMAGSEESPLAGHGTLAPSL